MFANISYPLRPTPFTARNVARGALGWGNYGKAADYYYLADQHLGTDNTVPTEQRSFLHSCFSQCARVAYRTAIEEGQKVKKMPSDYAVAQPEDKVVSQMLAGSLMLTGFPRLAYLTSDEWLLLSLLDPLAASNLRPDIDLGEHCRTLGSSKIERLFGIRHLAALAERGDTSAMERLANKAEHLDIYYSDSAFHALKRMQEAGVAEAMERLPAVNDRRERARKDAADYADFCRNFFPL